MGGEFLRGAKTYVYSITDSGAVEREGWTSESWKYVFFQFGNAMLAAYKIAGSIYAWRELGEGCESYESSRDAW
jgi:hypothetical protein